MAFFRYKGRNKVGKVVEGKIKGDTKKDVISTLRNQGISVTAIDEIKSVLYKEVKLFEQGVKSQDLVIYIRQFSTLLKAGISVVDATHILSEQTGSKALKAALQDVEENLKSGTPLSDAAEKHRNVFPPLYINMVRAAEVAGNLDEILDRLAVYFEKQHNTRAKVKSAMAYPAVVGIMAIVIVVFLLSTIVPTFAGMFQSFGSELPLMTKMVVGAGDWFKSFWWLFVLLIIGISVGFMVIKKHPKTKYHVDYAFFKMPIFGKLLQKAALARMTRTMASLFASSVPILQSVAIVEKIVGNEVIVKVLREARTALETGQSMVAPMERHWAFPPLVTQMLAVGEKTGSLDVMLDKVADFYETEVDIATDQIKSLIEPLMIVFLSVVVGGIVAAIAIPMFSLFDQIQ
ncbi:type II secretion system F family protein [Calidifontibacillus oryziterrae]|uniref:type II secretion system F family protein n=1 Tax=Calidifontibacillus oryziterrae TaxID=1191699 RepID=UPI0002E7D81D|nr:type II secretion system F family protein [Calidifontibacillus oryziterrae]